MFFAARSIDESVRSRQQIAPHSRQLQPLPDDAAATSHQQQHVFWDHQPWLGFWRWRRCGRFQRGRITCTASFPPLPLAASANLRRALVPPWPLPQHLWNSPLCENYLTVSCLQWQNSWKTLLHKFSIMAIRGNSNKQSFDGRIR